MELHITSCVTINSTNVMLSSTGTKDPAVGYDSDHLAPQLQILHISLTDYIPDVTIARAQQYCKVAKEISLLTESGIMLLLQTENSLQMHRYFLL